MSSASNSSLFFFKYFLMFIIVSEIAPNSFKNVQLLLDSILRNKQIGTIMLKVFTLLFTVHMIFDFVLFFMSNMFILFSPTIYDAVNNSLGILILQSMYQMGCKIFLANLSLDYHEIYNDADFLKFTTKRENYEPIQIYLLHLANLNSVFQLLMLIFES